LCVLRRAKDVGKLLSIYFGIACPPKASVAAFDFTEIGTFRSQLITNVHQFTGRVETVTGPSIFFEQN